MKKKLLIITFFLLMLGAVSCGKKEEKTEKIESIITTEETEGVVTPDVATPYNASEVATETDSKEEKEAVEEKATETDAVKEKNPKEDILIAIDPGHQSSNVDMSAMEPNAPGSSEMKMKATGGTVGRYTGVPEYKLNLDISLMLRNRLQEQGYKVILTREDNDTAISNSERATLANEAGADIFVRIHANGSEDSSSKGALAIIGSESNPNVGHLYDKSYSLADSILGEYCSSTGMTNLGIQKNDTMTGINWSQIPVMILEMGFMTNQQDDYNMQSPDYQKKMVKGIVNGINKYYGFSDTPNAGNGDEDNAYEIGGVLKEKIDNLLEVERDKGAVGSAYARNLTTDETINLSTDVHRSASIIKLFIAGAVYHNMDQMVKAGNNQDSIESLIKSMISVSDNESTNNLVRMLGSGDAEAGMTVVNDFITSLGFTDTSMGRLMLDFNSGKENYTTVTETGEYLEMIYHNKFTGADKILEYMKQQERVSKIPAGIPSGIVVANKTGELEDAEHDVAIIYGEKADIILCVMFSPLPDTASGRSTITKIASEVYDYWN